MSMLALPAPAWLRLSRLLAEVTYREWPGESEDHFHHRAFVDSTEYVDPYAEEVGFYLVGCGNFTAVYAHPDAPGVVFKLNAGTRDNMEEYHWWLMDQDHPNLPRVYHVEHYFGGCVAVSEELDEGGDFFGHGDAYCDVIELIEDAGFPVDDTHCGNIMRRGDTPVLNDPSSNRHESY